MIQVKHISLIFNTDWNYSKIIKTSFKHNKLVSSSTDKFEGNSTEESKGSSTEEFEGICTEESKGKYNILNKLNIKKFFLIIIYLLYDYM